ncbi:ornithine/diaminopimelate/arginine decarboxylase,family 2 [Novosphingobium nitrogenifigens DSM 19370]|uniref:Ornithine/diaminopimelate/arginine decarboxylase,family 2 n=1 Tax=Novosphingobium nitrogenifigens DSM 19370 TaxID=983920 RepID=F1Z924_9SPHN|nr:pyridoxal-dependent decarboxylase, exosortase A system-associated [Novosphingobium nitrogenifigens]EGD58956.1 ornithine/diaminopimelate/arginine decarboxylase,family 2 [Novosphingobium nitrogenifigens DSM 19370]
MTLSEKPMGPIPPGYVAHHGELVIAGVGARDLVASAGGTPLFVYDAGRIAGRVAALRAAMPSELGIHYAVKANPFAPLLAFMAGHVDGFDIASGGELALLTSVGISGARIGFAGPGKRDGEMVEAVKAGVTLHLESPRELDRAIEVGARLGIAPRLAIRVNPDFELAGAGMRMGGGARPFGIDADQVPDLVRRIVASGAEWRGFHVYAGSQSLDSEAIAAAQAATIDCVARLADAAGVAVPVCNLGGGFGIPYFHGQHPLDIDRIGAELAERLASLPASLAQTRFVLELGRWLVGEAGVYLTEILDRKISRGETFLVVDGGLHHQLAASGNFGSIIRRNYPCAVATRFAAPAEEVAHVVGCLCTPLDRLGDALALPHAEPGDLVALFCAGAYGASASPSEFLGHGPARQVLVGHEDEIPGLGA